MSWQQQQQQQQQQTPQLQVSELYTRRQSKDAARLRAYNKILDSIYHRIRVQSQMPNSPCSLLYTIPPFILGLPRIDLEDCVVYLVYQLRQAGFEVRYSFPNLIGISWMHHERNYILEQSPIMMAMMESDRISSEKAKASAAFLKKPKKAKSTNTVSFQNAVQTMRDPGAPSVGKLPSTSDYVPPTAFLQTMETPVSKKTNQVLMPPGGGSTSGILEDLWKL
jgi:hypothetical protein